MPA
ncbi:hypothetical protein YPPY34_1715, partial [Yersinia pestis PY-34]|jgi:hypothetical protein